MKRRARDIFLAACAGLGWALAAQTAAAQEEPIVIGQREKYRFLDLGVPEVTLELLGRYSDDSLESAGGEATEATTILFREIISGKTRGHILSPNVVELNLFGAFGLSQASTEAQGSLGSGDSNESGTFEEFDLSATIMRRSALPVTVYARQSNELINRPFASSLENTTSTYGVDWAYRSEKIPSTFRLYHTEQDQSALTGEDDFSLSQDSFEWHTEYRITERQSLTWDYNFNRIDQSSGGGVGFPGVTSAFDFHEANLAHLLAFGKDLRSELRSTANYYVQSGDFEQERLRLDENLLLRHSDTFETRYNYRFHDITILDSHQTQHRGTAGFTHRLFASLTTSGTVGAALINYDEQEASTREYFGSLAADYTKKAPLGRLSLSGAVNYNVQENDARAEPIRVFDEAVSFPAIGPVRISRRLIDPESIRVTDPTGTILYLRGLDYTVATFPDRIELRRAVGGNLPARSGALISYDIVPEPASEITTSSLSLGGRYDLTEGPLAGLAVYARYLRQDQEIDAGDSSFLTPDDIDAYTAGVEYRFWGFILSAEHEVHDSTVSPYDATRLEAQYLQRLGDETSLSLSASHHTINYEDQGETELMILSGTIDHRFSKALYGRASATWVSEKNSSFGDTIGFEQEAELRWKHRQTEVYGQLRHSTLDTDDQETSFLVFQMGIIRRF